MYPVDSLLVVLLTRLHCISPTQVNLTGVTQGYFLDNTAKLQGGAIYGDQASTTELLTEYNHTTQFLLTSCFILFGNEKRVITTSGVRRVVILGGRSQVFIIVIIIIIIIIPGKFGNISVLWLSFNSDTKVR